MKTRFFSLLTLALLPFFFAGCATSSPQIIQPLTEIRGYTPSSSLAQFIGSAPLGTSGSYTLPGYTQPFTVYPGQRYDSALGVPCRSAMAVGSAGQSISLAACLQDENWVLAPLVFAPIGE